MSLPEEYVFAYVVGYMWFGTHGFIHMWTNHHIHKALSDILIFQFSQSPVESVLFVLLNVLTTKYTPA